jgi:hypothetical protein
MESANRSRPVADTDQPVNDRFDGVFFVTVKFDLFFQVVSTR